MTSRMDNEEQRALVTNAPTSVGSAIADYYKRVVALVPVPIIMVMVMVMVMGWLPRAPEGHTEPLPTFLAGAAITVCPVVLMRCLRPISMTAKWALRWALGFGILFCLAAPLLGV